MHKKAALMGHDDKDAELDAYLRRCADGKHILSGMLREPNAGRGLVHTPREIAQQPFLWRRTAHRMQEHAPALRTFLESGGLYRASDRPQLILTGAGTSDYVGLSLMDLFRTAFGTPTMNWPTTQITAAPSHYLLPHQQSVIVHFARSGNSPESTNVLEMALRTCPDSIRHVVITCNEKGDLAGRALAHPDLVYLITLDEAANDVGLAMTSSFSNMVVAGQALVHLDDAATYCDIIERSARAAEHLIDTYVDEIFRQADPNLARIFYLGNADLLGASTESALKVQELSVGQIVAVGEDPLSFRHGPISAVDDESMVVFYLSGDAYTRQYELDVLHQYRGAFRKIGARVAVLGSRPDVNDLGDGLAAFSYDPQDRWKIPPFYQVNIATLFGQLFGLFASARRGLNVDDPSVAKALYSRTVQGVQIYKYSDGDDALVND